MQTQTTMTYHTCLSEWLSPKRTQTTSVDKDVKKLEPLCTAGGKVKWHSHCGKQYGESSKIRNKITI